MNLPETKVNDVREINIERDERRELYTVQVTGLDKTTHAARALSDGTLRFLALAVLEMDPEVKGVLCLEEPENGIHPERIPAMLRLLQDIACDTSLPIGPDNLLRQVIINTHSPVVVGEVPDSSLLIAEAKETLRAGQRFKRVVFSSPEATWRADHTTDIVFRGTLQSYLNPIEKAGAAVDMTRNGSGMSHNRHSRISRRVIDRPEYQIELPFLEPDARS